MLLRCSCFSALSYSSTGIIICQPFIAVQSMIAISSPNDQFGYLSFCTSALVNGQPWSMSSESMPMCLSPSVAILILPQMSCNPCMILLHLCNADVWDFLISMWWLCLDSQSAMNSCGPGLYNILML